MVGSCPKHADPKQPKYVSPMPCALLCSGRCYISLQCRYKKTRDRDGAIYLYTQILLKLQVVYSTTPLPLPGARGVGVVMVMCLYRYALCTMHMEI